VDNFIKQGLALNLHRATLDLNIFFPPACLYQNKDRSPAAAAERGTSAAAASAAAKRLSRI
jgi:hypothetical protein